MRNCMKGAGRLGTHAVRRTVSFETKRGAIFLNGLLVLSVLMMLPLAARDADATLTLSPTSGPPGATLFISGTGFPPNDFVTLYFDNSVDTVVIVAPNGDFTAKGHIPTGYPTGSYPVSVSDANGLSASATLTITPQTPSGWLQGTFNGIGVTPLIELLTAIVGLAAALVGVMRYGGRGKKQKESDN